MKVIAELGSNWKIKEDCFSAIKIAAKARANAIKFQMFTAKELYGVDSPRIQGELPREWVEELAIECGNSGIEFMCTGFSPNGYSFLNKYVNTHKIASAELHAPDILIQVNKFKKPVYLSTGGATIKEILSALEMLQDCSVTVFFCVADYPARIIDFRRMLELKEALAGPNGPKFGYSDHSIDVLNIPKLAKQAGAWVIEKHVNFGCFTDTPDAPHAINAEELALMVKNLNDKSTIHDSEMLCNQKMKRIWKRRYIHLPDGTWGWFRPIVF